MAINSVERNLIGCLLKDPRRFLDTRRHNLTPEYFTDPLCRQVYEVFTEIYIASGAAATPSLVADALVKRGMEPLDAALRVQEFLHTVENERAFPAYLSCVDSSRKKRLLQVFVDTASGILTEETEPRKAYQRIYSNLVKVEPTNGIRQSYSVGDGILAAMNEVAEMMDADELPGVATGLVDLDEAVGNFRPGEYSIVAGRPGSGKTAVLLNMSLYAPVVKKTPGLFITCEMPPRAIARRAISILSKKAWLRSDDPLDQVTIPYYKLRNPIRYPLSVEEIERMQRIQNALVDVPLYIEDGAGLTTAEIDAMVARYIEEGKTDPSKAIRFVALDYYQLVNLPNFKGDTKDQPVYEAVSEALRLIARKHNIPVIVNAQLSRLVEHRQDKRPMLSDLRNSGKAEQDADVVIGLYRDEYYNGDRSEDPGIIELILLKVRDGETKTIRAHFDGAYLYCENLANRADPNGPPPVVDP